MGLSSRPTYMPLVLPQSFVTMRCKGPQVIVACHEVFSQIMMHRPGRHFYFLHMLLQQKQYRGEIVIEEITDQNILFHSYHLEMAIYNWSGQVAGSSLNLCGSLR